MCVSSGGVGGRQGCRAREAARLRGWRGVWGVLRHRGGPVRPSTGSGRTGLGVGADGAGAWCGSGRGGVRHRWRAREAAPAGSRGCAGARGIRAGPVRPSTGSGRTGWGVGPRWCGAWGGSGRGEASMAGAARCAPTGERGSARVCGTRGIGAGPFALRQAQDERVWGWSGGVERAASRVGGVVLVSSSPSPARGAEDGGRGPGPANGL